MARESDEDALSWGDEGDPTYLDSPTTSTNLPASQKEPAASQREPAASTQRPSLADRRAGARSTNAGTTNAGTTNAPSEVATDGDMDVDADIAVAAEPQGMSSVMLLTLGVLAGVYLLYTVGWFTSAARNIAVPIGALDAVMAKVREYLSIAAPALWFGGTLLLTRHRKSATRVLLLILGAIVLLPLPFVLGV